MIFSFYTKLQKGNCLGLAAKVLLVVSYKTSNIKSIKMQNKCLENSPLSIRCPSELIGTFLGREKDEMKRKTEKHTRKYSTLISHNFFRTSKFDNLRIATGQAINSQAI